MFKLMKLNILLVGLIALFNASVGFASPITVDEIHAPSGLTIYSGKSVLQYPTAQATEKVLSESNSATVDNKTYGKNSMVAHQMRGVYDYSISGGATGASITLMTLPAKAIIKNAYLDIVTQPVALSGDSTTISIGAASTGDIKAAQTVIGMTTGQGTVQNLGASGSSIKLNAATDVTAVIGAGGLSAGKFVLFLDYNISE